MRAYIGLGSNLDVPVSQIQVALQSLKSLAQSGNLVSSSLYRNPPMGPSEQPDYVNAVASFDTTLGPTELLESLLSIESEQGRVRTSHRWGPRVIDLDILLFGDWRIRSGNLTIPHPGLHERVFVLVPLYEIAPTLVLPGGVRLSAVMAGIDTSSLVKVKCGP